MKRSSSSPEISTEWHQVLSENIALNGYFDSILHGVAKTFAEIVAQDFSDAYPIRNIDLVTSKEGKYLIRNPTGLVRELDSLESMILELSAGKLNFDTIVEIINSRTSELSPLAVRKAIIDRYANFDREFLLVWKNNTSKIRRKNGQKDQCRI